MKNLQIAPETTTCPVCTCPMSTRNPGTCQNCDYQTTWTPEEIEHYRDVLNSELETEPDHDDSVKCCPDCERPNQFGELCVSCARERGEQAYQ
jgi:hypothetical protein